MIEKAPFSTCKEKSPQEEFDFLPQMDFQILLQNNLYFEADVKTLLVVSSKGFMISCKSLKFMVVLIDEVKEENTL